MNLKQLKKKKYTSNIPISMSSLTDATNKIPGSIRNALPVKVKLSLPFF
jgi:hypothetical protein